MSQRKKMYTVSISTVLHAESPEQAALLFQDMFQDAEHPGWGVRVDSGVMFPETQFIDCETLHDRRDEIMGDV